MRGRGVKREEVIWVSSQAWGLSDWVEAAANKNNQMEEKTQGNLKEFCFAHAESVLDGEQ